MPAPSKNAIQLPKDHPLYKIVVYEPDEGQYYNTQTDIFLTDNDIQYMGLPIHPSIVMKCPSPRKTEP